MKKYFYHIGCALFIAFGAFLGSVSLDFGVSMCKKTEHFRPMTECLINVIENNKNVAIYYSVGVYFLYQALWFGFNFILNRRKKRIMKTDF